MDINKAFSNPETEKEGTWVDYRDGSRIKVARIGNPNFVRSYNAKMKPHRRKQRDGTLDDELESRLLCEAVAESVLLDWEGFTENGKTLKYTTQKAYDLLRLLIDFRNEVVEIASTEEVFHAEAIEDAEKNS
jgi:hypothetical protein